jgi:hypothetical protein
VCSTAPTPWDSGRGIYPEHTQQSPETDIHAPPTPWDSGREIYPEHTQQSPEADIHAPSGILNLNPSKRAPEDLHLRPRTHRDRHPAGIMFL